MLAFRILSLALTLPSWHLHSRPSPLQPTMAARSVRMSMVKAAMLSCWLMAADSRKRAGATRLCRSHRPGFECWPSTSEVSVVRRVRARRISTHAPFEKDVLAAVRYLKAHGAKTVSVVGGSFGGAAAGDASIKSAPGEIDRIVFFGAAPNLPADGLKSRALFIVARDDSNGSGPGCLGSERNTKRPPSRRN